jgi:hypothetical protein
MTTNDKRVESELVACDVCLKQLPKSEVIVPNAVDYFVHFFGLDLECQEKWKRQRKKTTSQ